MGSLNREYSGEKLSGKVYTPPFIVEKILDDAGFTGTSAVGKRIIDPACGDGRFLQSIVKRIIRYSSKEDLPENLKRVYGWDIDRDALKQARQRLDALIAPLGLQIDWQLECRNALRSEMTGNFDFVVGNPPYIRIQHLAEPERKYIQTHFRFCKSGATDIYIAFFELGYRLLKQTGKLAFITPNTFFHTHAALSLRTFLAQQQNIIQITNYGTLQLFEDAATYNAIVISGKQKRQDFLYQKAVTKEKFEERKISFDEISSLPFWQLSVKEVDRRNGVPLGKIADIHVGITTLADRVYILSLIEERKDTYLLQSRLKGAVEIEKSIVKPIIKASTLKKNGEAVSQYIIFPYRKKNGKMTIINEEVMQTDCPLAYRYLLSLKDVLDRRDNGKPNKVAWYAFGRSQGLETGFGKKILFSPMNKRPNFIYSSNEEATFYSGYCIKYDGDPEPLLKQLNSERMQSFIEISSRDFRSGWKAYNKSIVKEFIIQLPLRG